MKTKKILALVISSLSTIIGLILIIVFTKNVSNISGTVVCMQKHSSFIMADDKYCEVKVDYIYNDEKQTTDIKLAGLNYQLGEEVNFFILGGQTITYSDFIALGMLEVSFILLTIFTAKSLVSKDFNIGNPNLKLAQ